MLTQLFVLLAVGLLSVFAYSISLFNVNFSRVI